MYDARNVQVQTYKGVRSRSGARAEVSEGYWGSNIFSFQCVFIGVIASSLGST